MQMIFFHRTFFTQKYSTRGKRTYKKCERKRKENVSTYIHVVYKFFLPYLTKEKNIMLRSSPSSLANRNILIVGACIHYNNVQLVNRLTCVMQELKLHDVSKSNQKLVKDVLGWKKYFDRGYRYIVK